MTEARKRQEKQNEMKKPEKPLTKNYTAERNADSLVNEYNVSVSRFLGLLGNLELP